MQEKRTSPTKIASKRCRWAWPIEYRFHLAERRNARNGWLFKHMAWRRGYGESCCLPSWLPLGGWCASGIAPALFSQRPYSPAASIDNLIYIIMKRVSMLAYRRHDMSVPAARETARLGASNIIISCSLARARAHLLSSSKYLAPSSTAWRA